MIRRSVPLFLVLIIGALIAFVFKHRQLPEPENAVLAVIFALIAAPAIRFYWDKRREYRQKVVARGNAKARLREEELRR